MVDDKQVRRSLWVGDLSVFESRLPYAVSYYPSMRPKGARMLCKRTGASPYKREEGRTDIRFCGAGFFKLTVINIIISIIVLNVYSIVHK